MNEQTARDLRKRTVKELSERVGRVTEIIKAANGKAGEVIAREIVGAWEGNAVIRFIFTRPDKTLIVNGVRELPDSSRLSGGEGSPVLVIRMGT